MREEEATLSVAEKDFLRDLVESASSRKSWRERLEWVRDRLIDPAFHPGPGELASITIYLRMLATGELQCEEDGRHFRPNHHSEAALQIESALDRLSGPETDWILRRIYPFLPSSAENFRRAEPLTHIRDIAHRNDIPQDLKKEIKERLQNKLHRCAGPEDLRTSAEILQRITAPGANFAPAFVQEFQTFHQELQEFFNAGGLEQRLRRFAGSANPAIADAVKSFLDLKAKQAATLDQLLAALEKTVGLRQLLFDNRKQVEPHRRTQWRLADIGLEDYTFTLMSQCNNQLGDLSQPGNWQVLLRALALTFGSVRLSEIDPEECRALQSECSAWSAHFSRGDRFDLLHARATLARGRRLAEAFTDRMNRLWPARVQHLGRSLGIAEHAVKLFIEGDIRGHVVFQLSRLVDLGLQATRQGLNLPPWEAIVPGEATGRLVRARDLKEFEQKEGPFVVVLEQADGDAEIPAAVKAIALGHPMPHLSHLGVRARQARVPFVASASPEHLQEFAKHLDKWVHFRVTPAGVEIHENGEPAKRDGAQSAAPPVTVPDARLASQVTYLSLDQAQPETCGAKAAGAWRLLELAGRSEGLFQAPRGLAIPFGVMEGCLDAAPPQRDEYRTLLAKLPEAPPDGLDDLLHRLQQIISSLSVPEPIGKAVIDLLGADKRLAVRSSANGEDLENLAGAGLYDSLINIPVHAAPGAIAQVWASLWTRRATLSRLQAGIPHERVHMAVLVQELVIPDLSFIMHTVNPLTRDGAEALAELAVGLGEVLASSAVPGSPYRMTCRRDSGLTQMLACADFSVALRPGQSPGTTGIVRETLDYSRVPASTDPAVSERLGQRLSQIAAFLERELGRPQDVEGVVAGETIYLVQTRPQQGL